MSPIRTSGLRPLPLFVSIAAVLLFTPWTGLADDSPLGILKGRLVSLDGKPVAGGQVRLERQDLQTVEIIATSGPDGRFRSRPLAPVYRQRQLVIDAEGFARELQDEVTVFPGVETDLGDIILWQGRRVSGTVLDVDGKPRKGATVVVISRRNYKCKSVLKFAEWNVITDEYGRFVTPPVPLGRLGVDVTAPERRLASRAARIVPGTADVRFDGIRLEPDQPLVGLVVDEEGKPVEGATIDVQWSHLSDTKSDKEGHFPIRGFAPGMQFGFFVEKSGYVLNFVPCRFDALAAKQPPNLKVTLRRSGRIEGTVVDAQTGKPVSVRQLVLCDVVRQPDGRTVIGGCRNLEFEQLPKGRFRAIGPIREPHQLTVVAKQYNRAEMMLEASKSTILDAGVIKLQRVDASRLSDDRLPDGEPVPLEGSSFQRRIHGKVTFQGKPVSGAWVTLWTPPPPTRTGNQINVGECLINANVQRGRNVPRNRFTPCHAKTISSAGGAYDLYAPWPGTWYLVAEAPVAGPTIVGPLEIKATEDRKLDVALSVGGTITGRVVGTLPPDLMDQLWVVAFERQIFTAEAHVLADGTFRISNLPPGEYGLKVGHDGFTEPGLPWDAKRGSPEFLKAFDELPVPWKNAVIVKVRPGATTENVELSLPPAATTDSPK